MNKIEWIQSQLINYPNQTASQICSELNTPRLIDNPSPQQQVPVIPTLEQVLSVIPVEQARQITKNQPVLIDRLESALNNKDQFRIGYIYQILQEYLSEEVIAIINEILSQTMPDPNWQAQLYLSPAQEAGFDTVLTNEVEEAQQ